MPGLSRQALERAHRLSVAGCGDLPWQQVGGAALALGDPLAPPSQQGALLSRFLDLARARSLHPVLAPVSSGFRRTCAEAGLKTQPLGMEGEVDLTAFNLRGNARKNLRQSYERGRREGVRFELWHPPLSPRELLAVNRVSQEWLEARPIPELKIGLGWFDDRRLQQRPIAVARDAGGQVLAFATWHGEDRDPGLDLLRRRPGAPPGTAEVMLVDLLGAFREQGRRRVSLGLAPLTRTGAAGRAVRWLAKNLWGYDCRGLTRFKKKFNPRWHDRYIAYASWRGLGGILAAGVRRGS